MNSGFGFSLALGIAILGWCSVINATLLCEEAATLAECIALPGCAFDSELQTCGPGLNLAYSAAGSCDVPLNYTLPPPYGCPAGCQVNTLPNRDRVCQPVTFWNQFGSAYWGTMGQLPFGYLFWNLLLGIIIVSMIVMSPVATGWIVTTLVNLFLFEPSKDNRNSSAVLIQALRFAITGGKLSFRGFEYASANLHLRILRGGISFSWWLSESKVMGNDVESSKQDEGLSRQNEEDSRKDEENENRFMEFSPDETNEARNFFGRAKDKRRNGEKIATEDGDLDFDTGLFSSHPRLHVHLEGVELSVYNNSGRFTDLERSLLDMLPIGLFRDEIIRTECDLESAEKLCPAPRRYFTSQLKTLLKRCFRALICCSTQNDQNNVSDHSKGNDENDSQFNVANHSKGKSEDHLKSHRLQSESEIKGKKESASWFYRVCPVSLIDIEEGYVYIGSPALDSTFILNFRFGYCVHSIQDIPSNEINSKVDEYRIVNKVVLQKVRAKFAAISDKSKQMVSSLVPYPQVLRTSKTERQDVTSSENVALSSNKKSLKSRPSNRLGLGMISSIDTFANMRNIMRDSLGQKPVLSFYPSTGTQIPSSTVGLEDEDMDFEVEEDSQSNASDDQDPYESDEVEESFDKPLPASTQASGSNLNDTHSSAKTKLAESIPCHNTGFRAKSYRKRRKNSSAVLPEPDILVSSTVKAVFVYDKPGYAPLDEDIGKDPIPSPRLSLDVSIGSNLNSAESKSGNQSISTISFGPWAEAQRRQFMNHFFPPDFRNQAVYTEEAGEKRSPDSIHLSIVFLGLVSFWIPYSAQGKCIGKNLLFGDGWSGRAKSGGTSLWTSLDEHISALQQAYANQVKHDPVSNDNLHSESFLEKGERRLSSIDCVVQDQKDDDIDAASETERACQDGWIVDLNEEKLFGIVDDKDRPAITAILEYQTQLVYVIRYLLPVEIFDARTLWNTFGGRERLVSDKLSLFTPQTCWKEMKERLDLASLNLPLSADFDKLIKKHSENQSYGDGNLLKVLEEANKHRGNELAWLDTCRDHLNPLSSDEFDELKRAASTSALRVPKEVLKRLSISLKNSEDHEFINANGPEKMNTEKKKVVFGSFDRIDEDGPIRSSHRNLTSCCWIGVSFRSGSSLRIVSPLKFTDSKGSCTSFELQLKKPEMRSSFTQSDILACKSSSHKLLISYPNKWNGLQKWKLQQVLKGTTVWMLSEHVTSFRDLFHDWSSQAQPFLPNDPDLFVPVEYEMETRVDDATVCLLANPENIVSSLEDNSLNWILETGIPTVSIVASKSSKHFNASTEILRWCMNCKGQKRFGSFLPCTATIVSPKNYPRRNVVHPSNNLYGDDLFVKWTDPKVAVWSNLSLEGMFVSRSETSGESLTPNTKELDIKLKDLRVMCLPETLETFNNIRANYFGEATSIISPDDFAACGGENLRAKIGILMRGGISGTSSSDSEVFPCSDLIVRMKLENIGFDFPIHLHPMITPNGYLKDPSESAVLVTCPSIAMDLRSLHPQLFEQCLSTEAISFRFPSLQLLELTNSSSVDGFQGKRLNSNHSLDWTHQPVGSRKGRSRYRFSGRFVEAESDLSLTNESGKLDIDNLANGGEEYTRKNMIVLDGIQYKSQSLVGELGRSGTKHPVVYNVVHHVTTGLARGDVEAHDLNIMNSALNSFVSGLDLILDSDIENSYVKKFQSGANIAFPATVWDRIFNRIWTQDKRTILRIDIREAFNLPPSSDMPTAIAPSAYALVVCGQQRFFTSVVCDSFNPKWCSSYVFLADQDHPVTITLFDSTYGRNRKIGTFTYTRNPHTIASLSLDDCLFFKENETDAGAHIYGRVRGTGRKSMSNPLLKKMKFQTGVIDASSCHPCFFESRLKRKVKSTVSEGLHSRIRKAPNLIFRKGKKNATVSFAVSECILDEVVVQDLRALSGEAKKNMNEKMTDRKFWSKSECHSFASLLWNVKPLGVIIKDEKSEKGSSDDRILSANVPMDLKRTRSANLQDNSVARFKKNPGINPRNKFMSTDCLNAKSVAYASQALKILHDMCKYQNLSRKYARNVLFGAFEGFHIAIWDSTGQNFLLTTMDSLRVNGDTLIQGSCGWKLNFLKPTRIEFRHLVQSQRCDDVFNLGKEELFHNSSENGASIFPPSSTERHGDENIVWVQVGFVSIVLKLKLERKLANAMSESHRQRQFLKLSNKARRKRTATLREVGLGHRYPLPNSSWRFVFPSINHNRYAIDLSSMKSVAPADRLHMAPNFDFETEISGSASERNESQRISNRSENLLQKSDISEGSNLDSKFFKSRKSSFRGQSSDDVSSEESMLFSDAASDLSSSKIISSIFSLSREENGPRLQKRVAISSGVSNEDQNSSSDVVDPELYSMLGSYCYPDNQEINCPYGIQDLMPFLDKFSLDFAAFAEHEIPIALYSISENPFSRYQKSFANFPTIQLLESGLRIYEAEDTESETSELFATEDSEDSSCFAPIFDSDDVNSIVATLECGEDIEVLLCSEGVSKLQNIALCFYSIVPDFDLLLDFFERQVKSSHRKESRNRDNTSRLLFLGSQPLSFEARLASIRFRGLNSMRYPSSSSATKENFKSYRFQRFGRSHESGTFRDGLSDAVKDPSSLIAPYVVSGVWRKLKFSMLHFRRSFNCSFSADHLGVQVGVPNSVFEAQKQQMKFSLGGNEFEKLGSRSYEVMSFLRLSIDKVSASSSPGRKFTQTTGFMAGDLSLYSTADFAYHLHNALYRLLSNITDLTDIPGRAFERRVRQWQTLACRVSEQGLKFDEIKNRSEVSTSAIKFFELCPIRIWMDCEKRASSGYSLSKWTLLSRFRAIGCFIPEFDLIMQSIQNIGYNESGSVFSANFEVSRQQKMKAATSQFISFLISFGATHFPNVTDRHGPDMRNVNHHVHFKLNELCVETWTAEERKGNESDRTISNPIRVELVSDSLNRKSLYMIPARHRCSYILVKDLLLEGFATLSFSKSSDKSFLSVRPIRSRGQKGFQLVPPTPPLSCYDYHLAVVFGRICASLTPSVCQTLSEVGTLLTFPNLSTDLQQDQSGRSLQADNGFNSDVSSASKQEAGDAFDMTCSNETRIGDKHAQDSVGPDFDDESFKDDLAFHPKRLPNLFSKPNLGGLESDTGAIDQDILLQSPLYEPASWVESTICDQILGEGEHRIKICRSNTNEAGGSHSHNMLFMGEIKESFFRIRGKDNVFGSIMELKVENTVFSQGSNLSNGLLFEKMSAMNLRDTAAGNLSGSAFLVQSSGARLSANSGGVDKQKKTILLSVRHPTITKASQSFINSSEHVACEKELIFSSTDFEVTIPQPMEEEYDSVRTTLNDWIDAIKNVFNLKPHHLDSLAEHSLLLAHDKEKEFVQEYDINKPKLAVNSSGDNVSRIIGQLNTILSGKNEHKSLSLHAYSDKFSVTMYASDDLQIMIQFLKGSGNICRGLDGKIGAEVGASKTYVALCQGKEMSTVEGTRKWGSCRFSNKNMNSGDSFEDTCTVFLRHSIPTVWIKAELDTRCKPAAMPGKGSLERFDSNEIHFCVEKGNNESQDGKYRSPEKIADDAIPRLGKGEDSLKLPCEAFDNLDEAMNRVYDNTDGGEFIEACTFSLSLHIESIETSLSSSTITDYITGIYSIAPQLCRFLDRLMTTTDKSRQSEFPPKNKHDSMITTGDSSNYRHTKIDFDLSVQIRSIRVILSVDDDHMLGINAAEPASRQLVSTQGHHTRVLFTTGALHFKTSSDAMSPGSRLYHQANVNVTDLGADCFPDETRLERFFSAHLGDIQLEFQQSLSAKKHLSLLRIGFSASIDAIRTFFFEHNEAYPRGDDQSRLRIYPICELVLDNLSLSFLSNFPSLMESYLKEMSNILRFAEYAFLKQNMPLRDLLRPKNTSLSQPEVDAFALWTNLKELIKGPAEKAKDVPSNASRSWLIFPHFDLSFKVLNSCVVVPFSYAVDFVDDVEYLSVRNRSAGTGKRSSVGILPTNVSELKTKDIHWSSLNSPSNLNYAIAYLAFPYISMRFASQKFEFPAFSTEDIGTIFSEGKNLESGNFYCKISLCDIAFGYTNKLDWDSWKDAQKVREFVSCPDSSHAIELDEIAGDFRLELTAPKNSAASAGPKDCNQAPVHSERYYGKAAMVVSGLRIHQDYDVIKYTLGIIASFLQIFDARDFCPRQNTLSLASFSTTYSKVVKLSDSLRHAQKVAVRQLLKEDHRSLGYSQYVRMVYSNIMKYSFNISLELELKPSTVFFVLDSTGKSQRREYLESNEFFDTLRSISTINNEDFDYIFRLPVSQSTWNINKSQEGPGNVCVLGYLRIAIPDFGVSPIPFTWMGIFLDGYNAIRKATEELPGICRKRATSGVDLNGENDIDFGNRKSCVSSSRNAIADISDSRWEYHLNAELLPFSISYIGKTISTVDEVESEIVVAEAVCVHFTSGTTSSDHLSVQHRMIECVSLRLPSVNLNVHRPSQFATLQVRKVDAMAGISHGKTYEENSEKLFLADILNIETNINLWHTDVLFGLFYGWMREWSEAQRRIRTFHAARCIESQQVLSEQTKPIDLYSTGENKRKHRKSPKLRDESVGDDLFMLMDHTLTKEVSKWNVHLDIFSVSGNIDLGEINSRLNFAFGNFFSCYYQPHISGQNEPTDELINLFMKCGSFSVDSEGRILGVTNIPEGFFAHVVRDRYSMPSVNRLISCSDFGSADSYVKFQTTRSFCPALSWQRWLLKKSALSTVVVALRGRLCSNIELVFGNDIGKQHCMLFEMESNNLSFMAEEVFMDEDEMTCTAVVLLTASTLELLSSSDSFPMLIKLVRTLYTQVEASRVNARDKFLDAGDVEMTENIPAEEGEIGNDTRSGSNSMLVPSLKKEKVRAVTQIVAPIRALGSIEIHIASVKLSLVHGVLTDLKRSGAASLVFEEPIRLTLDIEKRAHSIRRDFALEVTGICEVHRFQQLLVSVDDPESRTESGTKLVKHLKQILSLNAFQLHMSSKQDIHRVELLPEYPSGQYGASTDETARMGTAPSHRLSEQILYTFRTEFMGDPIRCSTDIRDYNYIQEIIKSFHFSLRNLPEASSNADLHDPDLSRSSIVSENLNEAETEETSDIQLPAGSIKKRKFVLDTEEPSAFVFHPKLSVVGEASDVVLSRLMAQLQLRREFLPKKTHELATDTLEATMVKVNGGLRFLDKILGDR